MSLVRNSASPRVLCVALATVLIFISQQLVPSTTAHGATTGTMTITSDTTLDEDHDGNVVIDADGVTLNCRGHAITGVGDGVGILLAGRSGVTIKGCAVSNFGIGILGDSSAGNTMKKNTVSGNARYGIRLFRSDGNLLKHNAAVGNGRSGFFLTDSSGNVLTKNVATGHGQFGFRLSVSSDENLLTHNTATANDIGFDLFSTSGNTLKKNDACGNGTWDLRHRSSTGTEFVKNDFCTAFGLE